MLFHGCCHKIFGRRTDPCLHFCRPEEIKESDIGTRAGLFEVTKVGDEFYTSIVQCKDPKACTILLRGASKDVLNEVDFLPLTFISTHTKLPLPLFLYLPPTSLSAL